jgi:hypothetical protein
MPIATRADIEAIRGPRYLSELLRTARDFSSTPAEQLEQEGARLDEALQCGDDLIAQFILPLPENSTDARWNVLRRIAMNEALYYLKQQSEAGASEADDTAAQMRRKDLSHMRERMQSPGSTEGQSNQATSYVENVSSYSREALRGLI